MLDLSKDFIKELPFEYTIEFNRLMMMVSK